MAPTNQTFTLHSILEKDKLNGTNYADWIRNLRIVLRAEKKEEILDTPLTEAPEINASTAEKNAYKRACDADLEVSHISSLSFHTWQTTVTCVQIYA
jgi:hypothetical protein